MRRITIEYLPEHCPAREGMRCGAYPEIPEMLCHFDPERTCEFVRVEIEEKEREGF